MFGLFEKKPALAYEAIVAPYKARLLATKRPVVLIKTRLSSSPLSVTTSKFGGIPYCTDPASYPLAPDGKKLAFLAQINLSEVPPLPDWPTEGLLQFFVSDDENIGLEWSGHAQNIGNPMTRVIYSPIVEYGSKIQYGKECAAGSRKKFVFPPNAEYGLSFELSEETLSFNDYRFENEYYDQLITHTELDRAGDPEAEISKILGTKMNGMGHKLGGYPYFTQVDPRGYLKDKNPADDPYELLFQMDSEMNFGGKEEIMWGDAGVANFFIKRSDFIKRDFSNVLYNWDCS